MTEDAAQRALEELAALLEPLVLAAEDEAQRRAILAELGWKWEGLGSAGARIGTALEAAAGLRDVVVEVAAAASDGFDTLADALTALEAVTETVTAMQALARAFDGAGVPAPETFAALPGELLELLTVRHLERTHPRTLAVLELLTLADPATAAEPTPLVVGSDGLVVRREQLRTRLRFDRLPQLLTQPLEQLKVVYLVPEHGLATVEEAAAVADALFPRLQRLAFACGVPAAYGVNPALGLDLGEAGSEILPRTLAFWVTVPFEGLETTFGAALALASQDRGGIGLVVSPFGELAVAVDLGGWRLVLEAGGNLGGIAIGAGGVMFEPGGSPALDIGLQADKLPGADGGPALLIGGATGTRLEIGRFGVRTGGHFEAERQDYGFDVEIGAASFVVAAGEGDGFLQQVLPREGLRVDFDFGVGWSRAKGLHFAGSGGLEASFPLAAELPFGLGRIDAVHLALRAAQGGVSAELSTTASLTVGPFGAVIDRIGLAADLTFPAGGGNLGPAALNLRLKAPGGVGISIESELVSGGGFLSFDEPSGQYSGVFELTIAETVSVKVIGLISTKLPDGRPGFALLIIITAEGFTPIQLGMGFSLTGIGGLLALNRTIEIEAVRGGIKSGVLDSVLFPKDPVRNAGRVISTLNGVFPQAPDRLVVGPMATIAWGTPPIIKVRLAVLLELPDPLRIIVLASLSALLPDEQQPILQLRVDAVGVLDFKAGELSLDASIFDSRIWKFGLTGDIALRLRWKQDPQFLLSVGGFHPRYAPPPGFPQLERIALTLSEGENPRLRFDCYFALTSNSIQFGAHVELFATALGFEVSGSGGFDALIQWSPFLFVVDVFARLGVRFGGQVILAINLELGLEGPEPWRAHGVAEVQFLFIKAQVSFELQIGEDRAPPLPEEFDAAELLWAALTDRGNWSAALPEAERPGVTLRDAATDGIVAHPLATVSVRQRVLPLETRITRMGAHVPKGGPTSYRVVLAGDDTTDGLEVAPLTDKFALGQFQARTDDQRLTESDFVDRTAGYSVDAAATGRVPDAQALDSSLVVETLVIA